MCSGVTRHLSICCILSAERCLCGGQEGPRTTQMSAFLCYAALFPQGKRSPCYCIEPNCPLLRNQPLAQGPGQAQIRPFCCSISFYPSAPLPLGNHRPCPRLSSLGIRPPLAGAHGCQPLVLAQDEQEEVTGGLAPRTACSNASFCTMSEY